MKISPETLILLIQGLEAQFNEPHTNLMEWQAR